MINRYFLNRPIKYILIFIKFYIDIYRFCTYNINLYFLKLFWIVRNGRKIRKLDSKKFIKNLLMSKSSSLPLCSINSTKLWRFSCTLFRRCFLHVEWSLNLVMHARWKHWRILMSLISQFCELQIILVKQDRLISNRFIGGLYF